MGIGNGARGRRRAHLRWRAKEGWYYLCRAQLGWMGPYASGAEAAQIAGEQGSLWRYEEFMR